MRKVLILAMVAVTGLAVLLTGCGGGGGCVDGKTPGLYLAASPASVEANGSEQITVTASGLDSSCNPIGAGVSVEMRLANQEPENPGDNPDLVGQFASGGTSATVPMTNLGARTTLTSNVAGTASVTAGATIDGEYMSAIPVTVTFRAPPANRCTIAVEAADGSIPADGASSTIITATPVSYDGTPMTNGTSVNFSTNLGTFSSSGTTTAVIAISNGSAQATLLSEQLDQNQVATVTASFTCNDPLQTEASNDRDVLFSVGNQAFINLDASVNQLLADGVSTADLTAEVFMADGTPAPAGEIVSFLTDMGSFVEAPGGSPRAFDVLTDGEGKAYATFRSGDVGGTAHVSAAVYIDGETLRSTQDINLRQVGYLEWVSSDPTKLGVRGSGVNESAEITFKVMDNNRQAFPNVLVRFSASSNTVTLDQTQATTNDEGLVVARVNSGAIATSVTVTATVDGGGADPLEASSPALVIVGAKPSAKNFTFYCERFNVGGFILVDVYSDCTVLLADRNSNKIGFATAVYFSSEAGQIDGTAETEVDGVDMGSTTVTIRTSNRTPKDVSPLIDPAEPFVVDGNYTHNPRDGLLTIVAATTGEEEFTDMNGNGRYDDGEPFVDLGEPFIDEDDDGIRGPTEPFTDSNNNQAYDGPNGVWDGDTDIWTQTRMVWTGHYWGDPRCAENYKYSGLCGEVLMPPNDNPRDFNLAKGATRLFSWRVADRNLNPLNETTTVNMDVDGKGSLGNSSPPLSFNAPDALGTSIEFIKVNNMQTLLPCTDNDPICYIMPVVHGFSGGFSGSAVVEGAPITDTQPPEAGSVSLTVNYRESPGEGDNFSTGDFIQGLFQ